MKKIWIIILVIFTLFFILLMYNVNFPKESDIYYFIKKANGTHENGMLSSSIMLDNTDIKLSLKEFNLISSNSFNYKIDILTENKTQKIDTSSIQFDCLVYNEKYNLLSEYIQTGNQIANIFYEEIKNEINMSFNDFYNKYQYNKKDESNSYVQDTLLNFTFDEFSKSFNFERKTANDFENTNTYYIRIYNLSYNYFDEKNNINKVNLENKIFEFEINDKNVLETH